MESLTPTPRSVQPPRRRRVHAQGALRLSNLLHRTANRALANDVLNIAQSAAFSAIVALFPALIVLAALIGYLPDAAPLREAVGTLSERVLPAAVLPLLQGYFVNNPGASTSARALLLAVLVSVNGASGVILTFMEGLRRANDLPPDCWSFWSRRLRAIALVPLSLVPLAAASILVVFGHLLSRVLAAHALPQLHTAILVGAFVLRWTVALTANVGLVALLYHMGTPLRQPWSRTLPGAVLATLLWLCSTVAFGLYVTRFANYSRVYGSLGAGIALLFWLFLTSCSVLCGAEFNTVVDAPPPAVPGGAAPPSHPRPPPGANGRRGEPADRRAPA